MQGIIYKFTNLINKIYYVGQTTNVERFDLYWGSGTIWNSCLNKLKCKFPTCWKKLIKREILYQGNCTQVSLDKLEEIYIRREHALYSEGLGGCNILSGTANGFGSGSPAKDPFVRKKISDAISGRPCPESSKELFRKIYSGSGNPFYGKTHTKEVKERLSELQRGKRHNDESKEKISKTLREKYERGEMVNSMKGKHHSEETKRKISKAMVGEKNPMYRVSLSGDKHWNYGRHWDEEHRKHQSEILKKKYIEGTFVSPFKGKHFTEEQRKQISEKMKGKYSGEKNPFYGKHHSEETKEKIRRQRLLKSGKIKE